MKLALLVISYWLLVIGPPSSVYAQAPSLDYTIPFRDTSIIVTNPQAVKNSIKASWPQAKLENWDTIVAQSIQRGWNPAFVLTLWVEESGAQGVSGYSDPLGCDPAHPTTDINRSLGCLFNSFQNYQNFADFMCRYSENKQGGCIFSENPNFPKNVKKVYSQLVQGGTGTTATAPTTPSQVAPSVPSGTTQEGTFPSPRALSRSQAPAKEEGAVYNLNQGLIPESVLQQPAADQKNILQLAGDLLTRLVGLFIGGSISNPEKLHYQSETLHQSQTPEEVKPKSSDPAEQVRGFLGGSVGFYGVNFPEFTDKDKIFKSDVGSYEKAFEQASFPEGIRPVTPTGQR